jgi:hypothetical protein
VTLRDLPAVTSIQSLSSLTQVGFLSLVRTGVMSLDGLEDLESVEQTLSLEENPALSDLSALLSLTGDGGIYVADNPELPTCQVEGLLARSTWQSIYVSGNDDGAQCPP